MTVFDQVLQAREQAKAASGIVPNSVRLGEQQWAALRRRLADDAWPPCMEFREPGALYIHDLRVRVEMAEPDLLEAIVYLEVPVG